MVMDIRSGRRRRVSLPPEGTERLYFVDDPRAVSSLRTTGEARWVLPANAPGFPRFGPLRLAAVRAWLEGARVPDGGTVDLRLSTRGDYLERGAGTSYRFVSTPLVRDLRYRVTSAADSRPDWLFPDGSVGHIEVDGQFPDGDGAAHIQPTPMAEWHLVVSGDGLDLTDLTRVVMEFAGSANPLVGSA